MTGAPGPLSHGAERRACSICRRDRVQVHSEAVVSDRGVVVNGRPLCQRCFEDTHPVTWCAHCMKASDGLQLRDGLLYCPKCIDWRPPTVRRSAPRRAEWETFRDSILAAMTRDGICHYVSADHVAGRCPICSEVLGVRFFGRTPAARLTCHGGCTEQAVAATLGKARRR